MLSVSFLTFSSAFLLEKKEYDLKLHFPLIYEKRLLYEKKAPTQEVFCKDSNFFLNRYSLEHLRGAVSGNF